ncbi:hypothetical protein D3C76_1349040 [compost metagenome]
MAACALVHHFALNGQGGGDVGQRCQVAAGAHRAFLGNQRQDVVGEKVAQALQQQQAYPRNAMAQRAQPGGQHCACGRRVEMTTQAATVEGVQVTRQGLDMLHRHGNHAGVAVAGGDAIDHAFLVQQGVEEACAAVDVLAIPGVVLQVRRGAAFSQGNDFFDRQWRLAKGYSRVRGHRHRSSLVRGEGFRGAG